jgi:hypothetical protein
MFTGRLDALPDSFRVACFRARRSTHVTVFYTFHLARGVGLETYLVVRPVRLKYWDIQLMSAGRHTHTTAPC